MNKRIKIFIIAFIVFLAIISVATPYIRNYDYSHIPVSPLALTKDAKVIVVEGNISNGKIDGYELTFDKNINCIPTSGYKKVAGYWTTNSPVYSNFFEYAPVGKFSILWVVNGC